MLQGINIEEVKKYNESLKQYKEQSNRLTVEIEMNEKELNNLCEQLSAELGIQVTPDNVEKIYEEQVEKINQTLETGNAILQKIEQEASNPIGTLPNVGVNANANATTPVAPPPAAPVAPSFVSAAQNQSPAQPLFTGQSVGDVSALPPVNSTPTINQGTPLFSI